jgi:hypothetical protein
MIDFLENILLSKKFLYNLHNTYSLYFTYGSRSNKKVDYFHNYIKNEIENIIIRKKLNNKFIVKLEQNIESYNLSGKKKCDIVVFMNNKPYIIIPVKLVMTNYKQNKYNYFENLTGELLHIFWKNENIKIIPIYIYMNQIPYLNDKKKIVRLENITYEDIEKYNILQNKNIVYHIISYIINVTHKNNINEVYDTCPDLLGFNYKTKYNDL